jgi:hypothetical protein
MSRKETTMNKDAYGTASFGGDVEPILPDGWEEGMDIFADSEVEGDILTDDDRADDNLDELLNESGESDETAPTTGAETDDVPGAGAETTESPDGADKAKETVSRIRKLKVNHEEREIDLGSLSDDDLIAHLQKSYAFDAMKDKENQQKYRDVYQEQLDAGMTEHVAKLVAREAAGKTYSLTDEEETAAPALETVEPTVRNFASEVEQLKTLYPDIKEIPDEVAKAASKGVPVLTAFLAYREKQSAKTAAALRAENTVLKQNAASAAKAPVKGVTGGGNPPTKKSSPFEDAFDRGLKWR